MWNQKQSMCNQKQSMHDPKNGGFNQMFDHV